MISVVIPAFNSARYIAETLESILNQTYQGFEIIVVDDGSTDNTVEIVQRYANRDPRICLIQNEHGGVTKARNTGIAFARYDWIAPVDSDDVLLPQRFEKQLAAAAHYPEVIGWGTYATRITMDGKPYSTQQNGPTTIEEFERMRKEKGELLVLPASSVLLRKDIIEKVGGYSQKFSGTLEDLVLLDDMAEYGPILVIPESLILYRMYFGSTTSSWEKFRKQRVDFSYFEHMAKARANNRLMQDYERFVTRYHHAPAIIKAIRYLDDYSAYACRVSAQRFGEQKYVDFLKNTAVSLVLNPYYVSIRVWSRVFKKRSLSHRL